jgi:hypothetical protein
MATLLKQPESLFHETRRRTSAGFLFFGFSRNNAFCPRNTLNSAKKEMGENTISNTILRPKGDRTEAEEDLSKKIRVFSRVSRAEI